MTDEQIIQRATAVAERLRAAAQAGDRFEYHETARKMRSGAAAIEDLVGLLRQKREA